MSVIRHDPADRAEPKSPHLIARLIDAGERFVAGKAEGTIVLSALVAFAVLWMLYDTASLATADAHPDVSEATDWAHEFAFGYKHPPMTAWLYILWFTVFPHRDWAALVSAVTINQLRGSVVEPAIFSNCSTICCSISDTAFAELGVMIKPCGAPIRLVRRKPPRSRGILLP